MPQVNAIKAAGIKCVDVWLTPQDQAAFVQDLHSAGYNATVFGNDETNADDTFSKLAGDLADGTISAALTSGLHPSPELKAFREEYPEAFNVESDAVRRNELRQHHDAGAGDHQRPSRPSRRTCRRGSTTPQRLQGHHRRSNSLETITRTNISVAAWSRQGCDQAASGLIQTEATFKRGGRKQTAANQNHERLKADQGYGW